MGTKLLNGSAQLSVRVTTFSLILIVLSSTVTPGTIAGAGTTVIKIRILCAYQNCRELYICI